MISPELGRSPSPHLAAAQAAAFFGAATGTPCEFHLLNPLRSGGHGAEVDGEDFVCCSRDEDVGRLAAFLAKVHPRGVTPLAERLRQLRPRFATFADDAGASGKMAFLVIATDGAPTPTDSGTPTPGAATAALRELRALTATLPVRLVVRLCTDEDAAVEFWNKADEEVELPLDVLDDFTSEAAEVQKNGNGWLSYSPALHMLRECGTLVGLLDLLDERTLRPGEAATLAGLLLQSAADEEPLPDWKHERSAFASALRAKAAGAAQVFDGSTRRLAPQVKADAALRAIHGQSVASMLLAVLVAVAAVSLMALLAKV